MAEKLSKIPWDNHALLWNITDILSYMDLLNELDTTDIIPTVSVIDNAAKLREDVIVEKEISPKDLLACSSQKVVSQQVVLPNIMK